MTWLIAGGVLRPVIQKLIAQVRYAGSSQINLISSSVMVAPRQRQKRRIGPKVTNSDLSRTTSHVPTKMRKQWIHQAMREATPRPTNVDEIGGTEEEHMDVDRSNYTLLPLPC